MGRNILVVNRNTPKPKPFVTEPEILSRRDFQEILLARMAGGDLYANELRMKFRRADQLLDVLRPTPIYPGTVHKPNAPVGDNSPQPQPK